MRNIRASAVDRDRPNGLVSSGGRCMRTSTLLLAGGEDLNWSRNGKDLNVTLPAQLPESYAYVLKITPRPWKLLRE